MTSTVQEKIRSIPLRLLVKLLYCKDTNYELLAVCELQRRSEKDSTIHEEIYSESGITGMCELLGLRTSETQLQLEIMRTLSILAQNEQHKNDIGEAGGVVSILSCMNSAHESDVLEENNEIRNQLVISGALLLETLFTIEQNRRIAAESDAFSVLFNLVQRACSSRVVTLTFSLRALSGLVDSHNCLLITEGNQDWITILFNLLIECEKPIDISNILRILSIIVQNDRQMNSTILDHASLQCKKMIGILRNLSWKPEDKPIALECLHFLAILSIKSSFQEDLFESGFLTQLCRWLNFCVGETISINESSHYEVSICFQILFSLSNLLSSHEIVCEAFCHLNGVDLLCKLLEVGDSPSEAVMEKVIKIFTSFLKIENCLPSMLSSDTFVRVAGAISAITTSVILEELVVNFIQTLCNHLNIKYAVPILLDLLLSRNTLILLASMTSLSLLATNVEVQQIIRISGKQSRIEEIAKCHDEVIACCARSLLALVDSARNDGPKSDRMIEGSLLNCASPEKDPSFASSSSSDVSTWNSSLSHSSSSLSTVLTRPNLKTSPLNSMISFSSLPNPETYDEQYNECPPSGGGSLFPFSSLELGLESLEEFDISIPLHSILNNILISSSMMDISLSMQHARSLVQQAKETVGNGEALYVKFNKEEYSLGSMIASELEFECTSLEASIRKVLQCMKNVLNTLDGDMKRSRLKELLAEAKEAVRQSAHIKKWSHSLLESQTTLTDSGSLLSSQSLEQLPYESSSPSMLSIPVSEKASVITETTFLPTIDNSIFEEISDSSSSSDLSISLRPSLQKLYVATYARDWKQATKLFKDIAQDAYSLAERGKDLALQCYSQQQESFALNETLETYSELKYLIAEFVTALKAAAATAETNDPQSKLTETLVRLILDLNNALNICEICVEKNRLSLSNVGHSESISKAKTTEILHEADEAGKVTETTTTISSSVCPNEKKISDKLSETSPNPVFQTPASKSLELVNSSTDSSNPRLSSSSNPFKMKSPEEMNENASSISVKVEDSLKKSMKSIWIKCNRENDIRMVKVNSDCKLETLQLAIKEKFDARLEFSLQYKDSMGDEIPLKSDADLSFAFDDFLQTTANKMEIVLIDRPLKARNSSLSSATIMPPPPPPPSLPPQPLSLGSSTSFLGSVSSTISAASLSNTVPTGTNQVWILDPVSLKQRISGNSNKTLPHHTNTLSSSNLLEEIRLGVSLRSVEPTLQSRKAVHKYEGPDAALTSALITALELRRQRMMAKDEKPKTSISNGNEKNYLKDLEEDDLSWLE